MYAIVLRFLPWIDNEPVYAMSMWNFDMKSTLQLDINMKQNFVIKNPNFFINTP